MFKDLFFYKSHDDTIASKGLEVLQRHGWYLDQSVVPFALFSPKLSNDEKENLAAKILLHAPQVENPVFEIQKQRFPEITPETVLGDLVGERSFLLFSLLKVNYDWLAKPINEWEDSPDYKKVKEFVVTAKTVNDFAERAVKLMTDYATILTTNEEKRQLILQGVAENRRTFNNFQKRTLNKSHGQ